MPTFYLAFRLFMLTMYLQSRDISPVPPFIRSNLSITRISPDNRGNIQVSMSPSNENPSLMKISSIVSEPVRYKQFFLLLENK